MSALGRGHRGHAYLLQSREREQWTQTIKGPRRVWRWTKWKTIGWHNRYSQAYEALNARKRSRGLEDLRIFCNGRPAHPCCGEYGTGSGEHLDCSEHPE